MSKMTDCVSHLSPSVSCVKCHIQTKLFVKASINFQSNRIFEIVLLTLSAPGQSGLTAQSL